MALDLTPAARIGGDLAGAEREGGEASHLGGDFRAAINDHATRIDAHATQINTNETRIAGQNATLAGHTTQLAGQDATLTEHTTQLAGQDATLTGHTTQLAGHDTALTGHTTQLNGHGTRLTNLEADRLQDRSPLSAGEQGTNNSQITTLKAIKDDDLSHVTTGHPSMDKKLQDRIKADPMVKHQTAKLTSAVADMERANTSGNRADFIKAAGEAETAAKDLDATRKSIEQAGVFQGGNKYTTRSTIVSGTLAGAGIAGAATTGGIIAWNNKKQGDKA